MPEPRRLLLLVERARCDWRALHRRIAALSKERTALDLGEAPAFRPSGRGRRSWGGSIVS